MNNRGVFITFMVFLLVASVLALHNVTKKVDFMQERKDIDEAAFNVVNNAFNNLYEEVVSLNKEGYAKIVQQRPMPFEYGFSSNSLILRQRIPVRVSRLKAYIDALNIYSIFANSEEGKRELNIATTTVQDSLWGSSIDYPDLNYAILPQCLLYDVNECCNDVNLMVLKELNDGEHGCTGGFDYADLNVVDVNISIDSRGCSSGSIGGWLAGKNEDPDNVLPYLKITINERNINCPGAAANCPITGNASGKEVIRTPFDPTETTPAEAIDSLKIKCETNDWLRIKIGKDFEDENDPYPVVIYNWLPNIPVYVDLNITFDQKVELFYFTGFSISVNKKNFPIKRST